MNTVPSSVFIAYYGSNYLEVPKSIILIFEFESFV